MNAQPYGAFIGYAYASTALGFAWMVADTLWRAFAARRALRRAERQASDPPDAR